MLLFQALFYLRRNPGFAAEMCVHFLDWYSGIYTEMYIFHNDRNPLFMFMCGHACECILDVHYLCMSFYSCTRLHLGHVIHHSMKEDDFCVTLCPVVSCRVALHCVALRCIVLHCVVLHCVVLCCIMFMS